MPVAAAAAASAGTMGANERRASCPPPPIVARANHNPPRTRAGREKTEIPSAGARFTCGGTGSLQWGETVHSYSVNSSIRRHRSSGSSIRRPTSDQARRSNGQESKRLRSREDHCHSYFSILLQISPAHAFPRLKLRCKQSLVQVTNGRSASFLSHTDTVIWKQS